MNGDPRASQPWDRLIYLKNNNAPCSEGDVFWGAEMDIIAFCCPM